MKFFSLFAIVLCCNVAGSLAQQPAPDHSLIVNGQWMLVPVLPTPPLAAPCGCKTSSDDNADMAEAVARGFGSRLAIGPFKEATTAVRAWRASDGNDLKKLQARLDRTPRFTECQKATMALIALEMTNSFSPGTIPPQVIQLAIQLQAAACSAPPVPTLAPIGKIPPVPKKHATGLIILPEKTRNALHVRDALTHKAFHSKHGAITIPSSLDLRSGCPAIEDQDGVGTCHDHSGVDTVCCANIKDGNLTISQPLSVQYIVDLDPNGDGTCDGGDATTIFQWLKQGNGIPTVQSYGPEDNACNQGCQLSGTASGFTIQDWGYAGTVTGPADVQSVEESLVTYGVTSVCIGCPDDFMNYSGGIYVGDLSSGIDHQVSLVGYKIDPTVSGGGYFILRNSWGTGWGEKGYARVAFSCNATTESMWATAKKGQTTVVQPFSSPTPSDRVLKLYEMGRKNPTLAKKALKAAEDVFQNAP
jgi:C1A family cysteine protease